MSAVLLVEVSGPDSRSSWGGVSLPPVRDSQTAAGCPRTQLSSDCIYPQTASDPQARAQPCKLPLPPAVQMPVESVADSVVPNF